MAYSSRPWELKASSSSSFTFFSHRKETWLPWYQATLAQDRDASLFAIREVNHRAQHDTGEDADENPPVEFDLLHGE